MENRVLSPDLLKAVEEMTKPNYNLKLPDGLARDSKGWARWSEYVRVESALTTSQVTDYGPRTTYQLKAKVVPFGDNGASPNVGRTITAFLGVNYDLAFAKTEAEKAAAVGTKGTVKTAEYKNGKAISNLKQLMVALGYDLTGGLNESDLLVLFPSADGPMGAAPSPMVGVNLIFGMSSQLRREGEGEYQNVDSIVKAPSEA